MAERTVTVFGGSGFIGRYVVERLAERGWIIRVAVRHPERAQFLKPLGDVGQIVPLRCNVRNADSLRDALSGTRAAVNLVGILYESGAQRFARVHFEAAKTIAELAGECGLERLVHISAIGADPDAASEYARSKGAAEQAVFAAFHRASVIRPSIVFGPEDEFFNRFAVMARLAPALPLIGGGETRFQPAFVGDVAEAIVRVLENPKCAGHTYELGGPRVYSFAELMKLMLHEIGRKRLLVPLSFSMAKKIGSIGELLPVPPLTRDQVILLEQDNVVSEGAEGFAALGIEPTSVEVVIPTYLRRYRRGGRFGSVERST